MRATFKHFASVSESWESMFRRLLIGPPATGFQPVLIAFANRRGRISHRRSGATSGANKRSAKTW
jgi:hypothetical protein